MTISPPPTIDLSAIGADWPDEVADLSDRRRLLVRVVLGVDLTSAQADAVFSRPQAGSSTSTTMRSGGRSSSTVDR